MKDSVEEIVNEWFEVLHYSGNDDKGAERHVCVGREAALTVFEIVRARGLAPDEHLELRRVTRLVTRSGSARS